MKKLLLFLLFTSFCLGQTKVDWVSQTKNKPILDAREYNFKSQSPGGSLVSGNNTITIHPVPLGVNGTDANHWLYVSGGTGTAETCKIVGGTAVAGTSTGSLIINCSNSHSGAWTIQSTSSGIAEATTSLQGSTGSILSAVSGGGTVIITPGNYSVYAPIYLTSGVTLEGTGPGVLLTGQSTPVVRTALYNTTGWGVNNLTIRAGSGYSGFIGIDVQAANTGIVQNVVILGNNVSDSIGIRLLGVKNADTTFDYHNFAAQNIFRNLIITGVVKGVVFAASGNGTGGSQAGSTQNEFYDLVFNLGGTCVDFQSNTDTNFFYNLYCGYSGSDPGIIFNSGTPSTDNGVGGNQFFGLSVSNGGNSASIPLVFNYTDNNQIFGFTSVGSLTPYTITANSVGNVVHGFSSGDSTNTRYYFPGGSAIRSDDGSANFFYMFRSITGTLVLGDSGHGTQIQGSLNVIGPTFTQLINFIQTETGANNAIAGTLGFIAAPLDNLVVTIKLAHTLQVGANTFNYGGAGAAAIKSSKNPANNIATGYAVGGIVQLVYSTSAGAWLDLSQ